MSFQEREGFRDLKKQITEIDEETRNSIWNVFVEFFICMRDTDKTLDKENYKKIKYALFRYLWKYYFKKPIDDLPINRGPSSYGYNDRKMLDYVKSYIISESSFEDLMAFLEAFNSYNIKRIGEHCDFKNRMNVIFKRENVLWRFVENKISRFTNELEIRSIEEAMKTPFDNINKHIETALEHYSDKTNPDYRNSIKESISAVEAICKLIVNDPNTTLGRALNYIENNIPNFDLHPDLKEAFKKLYHYTSDSDGIRHSLKDKANVTYNDAKYFLVICSAFVNYLLVLANGANISLS